MQSKDLLEVLPAAEDFAINELIPALAKGGFISDTERNAIAEKMSSYSGLSKKVILQQNLDVPNRFFWKELLRDKSGQTIGRLDSRYKGLDKVETGSFTDYNAEISSHLTANNTLGRRPTLDEAFAINSVFEYGRHDTYYSDALGTGVGHC